MTFQVPHFIISPIQAKRHSKSSEEENVMHKMRHLSAEKEDDDMRK